MAYLLPDEKILLKWRVHPAAKNRGKLLFAMGTIVASSIVVYISFHSLFYSLFALIFLTFSIASFLFPTSYIFTEERLIIENIGKREKRWDQLRRFVEYKDGVLLSPFTRPSRLDNYRGIYVRFDKNKDEVLVFIKDKLSSNRSSS